MSHTLQLILLLLAAAVAVIVLCRMVRLPPILGYVVIGIAVGPHALGWVPDNNDVRDLAEFGIVFLMFSIGLEFSLPQLNAMRRAVFGLGLAQVAITTVMAMVGLHLLGFAWLQGFTLGGALAMSSTAIVSKMLAERMELNTAHGRDVMGILLFQDLAVVAFLIAVPTLATGATDLWRSLGIAAGKAAVALAVILIFGQRPMRAWFHIIARARSSELFMLNVLLVTLGLAALTELAGLSFALGAFLAGMLIAETEYRYQVEEDIKPFRDVLLGLFFVTVGMYLDLRVVGANLGWVALLLVGPELSKLILVAILARLFGAPLGASLRTGFYLAQAGEFAIVLLALASDLAVIEPTVAQLVLADMATALKILHHVQQLRRELPVIVRTVDDSELDRLIKAGATEVVPEVLEGSLMLASHSLLLLGVPLNRVLARIREIREERYSLFRGFFHGATDAADAADNLQPRLHSVLLTDRSAAVGRTLGELDFKALVEVTGVRPRGMRMTLPASDYRLVAGDVVVLLGRPENLTLAERRLLRG